MDRKYRPSSQRTAARTCVLVLTLTGMMTLGTAVAWAGEPTPTTQSQLTGTSQQPGPTGTSQQPGPTGTGQQPGPTGTSQQPGPTGTSQQQDPSPPSIPVTVSPRSAKWGTTVKLTADLRGCTRPKAAEGFFYDRKGWGVDGAAKPLISERVTGGRWYTAQYQLTKWDAVGQGRFGVVCDFNLPTERSGYASLQVQRLVVTPVQVRVTPQAGGPGTMVRLSAETPECQDVQVSFYDRKGLRTLDAAKGLTWRRVTPRRITGQYTVTNKDAVGQGQFRVVCYLYHNPPYDGYPGSASFQVRGAGGAGGSGGGSGGNGHTANRDDTQLPNRIDTGQGGTADGISQGGLDRVWLLPAAGLLLILLAAGLWLRQRTASSRR
jgi:hypothetical protein